MRYTRRMMVAAIVGTALFAAPAAAWADTGTPDTTATSSEVTVSGESPEAADSSVASKSSSGKGGDKDKDDAGKGKDDDRDDDKDDDRDDDKDDDKDDDRDDDRDDKDDDGKDDKDDDGKGDKDDDGKDDDRDDDGKDDDGKDKDDDDDDHKVTICHATGSEKNPFVKVTLSTSGAFNGHFGNDHQDGRDIIPPFKYKGKTYSQNWDEVGKAVYHNDCEVKHGPVVPGDGNGLGSELVILGSLPLAAGAVFMAHRRRQATDLA